MPDFSVIQIVLLASTLVIGVILGWIFRGERCSREKIAVNASWQEQIDAQQSEHDRLSGQNVSLMEQIGQYQASNKDSKNRARELSDALKEAFERRDELQRSFKDIRTQFEVASAQRDRLLTDIENNQVRGQATAGSLKEKDDKIFRLSRELTTWQSRVPPLVERFKDRDNDAKTLQAELDAANERIAELESTSSSDQTRIEPVDAENLPNGLNASNEPHDGTMTGSYSVPEDQIDLATPIVVVETSEDESEEDEFGGDDDVDETEVVIEIDDDEETEETAVADDSDAVTVATDDVKITHDEIVADEHDDLKLIKGVGPAIEKTLNSLGVYRFNQIAEMSEYDIDRVAQQLRGFRSRIYREDWIGQARTLQYEKNIDTV